MEPCLGAFRAGMRQPAQDGSKLDTGDVGSSGAFGTGALKAAGINAYGIG